MSALILFVAAFCIVFALGFQSLNVNRGHYIAAAVTSLAIGTANLVLLKLLPAQTTPLELAAYLGGGPLGIVASMWAHKRWMKHTDPWKDYSVIPDTTQGPGHFWLVHPTQSVPYNRTDPDVIERSL